MFTREPGGTRCPFHPKEIITPEAGKPFDYCSLNTCRFNPNGKCAIIEAYVQAKVNEAYLKDIQSTLKDILSKVSHLH